MIQSGLKHKNVWPALENNKISFRKLKLDLGGEGGGQQIDIRTSNYVDKSVICLYVDNIVFLFM